MAQSTKINERPTVSLNPKKKMPLVKSLLRLRSGSSNVRQLAERTIVNNNGSNWSDVAIIGGGIMGSSIAYFLKDRGPKNLNISVFERDFNYNTASTVLSVGGIRQQFSLPENIQMSMYTADFLRHSRRYLSAEEPVNVELHRSGYLTLANEKQAERLMQNYAVQRKYGASVELLTATQVKQRFPMINTDGIKLAVIGTENEGWFDPYQLLMAMKHKARFLGVNFVHGTVTSFKDVRQTKCQGIAVKLCDGTTQDYRFDVGIICAGYNSTPLARSLGYGSAEVQDFRKDVDFPIEPRKRYVYVAHCRDAGDPGDWQFPFLIDNTGVYCRQEGSRGNFLCGRSPSTEDEEPPIENLDVDYSYFETHIHPDLAHRVPCFEAIKIKSAWAGFYDYNRLDQNAIIGPDPFYSNIYWATGFSGHGIQMAPAVGRAMMEYITKGRYETIDLRRFGWNRILENKPLKELNII